MNAACSAAVYISSPSGAAPGENPCMTNVRKSLNTFIGSYPFKPANSQIRFSSGRISGVCLISCHIVLLFMGLTSLCVRSACMSVMVRLYFCRAPPRKESAFPLSAMFHSDAGSPSIPYGMPRVRAARACAIRRKVFLAASRPVRSSFFPRVKGECLPIDKGIQPFLLRLTLDDVFRPLFRGVLSVQRIGFRGISMP